MDNLTPGFYLNFLQFAWLLAVTAGVFLRKPGEDAGKHLDELQKAVNKQDQANASDLAEQRAKTALLEERVKNMPTHNDIRALFETMADLKGQLSAVRESQLRQIRALEMIQDFMNKSK
jgi:hypothetical protein